MPCQAHNPLGRHYTRFLTSTARNRTDSLLPDRSLQRESYVLSPRNNVLEIDFSGSTVEVGLTQATSDIWPVGYWWRHAARAVCRKLRLGQSSSDNNFAAIAQSVSPDRGGDA